MKRLFLILAFCGVVATSCEELGLDWRKDIVVDVNSPQGGNGENNNSDDKINDSYYDVVLDNPTVINYDVVDLGLSVKWATCNLGAAAPHEAGAYYSWGEIAPKSNYDHLTYKWCLGNYDNMTKYCDADGLRTLEPEDDIATVLMGEGWRLPTYAEFKELLESCELELSSQNGVNGCLVSRNSNEIFFPAVGSCYYDEGVRNYNVLGSYWTSSIYELDNTSAWAFSYEYDDGDVFFEDRVSRYPGLAIRAVKE